jgi:fatty acid kinase fatty acid binding subunit
VTVRTVGIVTDSTAFIPRPLLDQYRILVLPNLVNWGTESYRDGVDIQPSEFFERLKTDPVQPTTSASSAGECHALFQQAFETAEAVVAIHISTKLSGTYQSAVAARAMMPDQPVTVIDAQSTAMALGFVVLAAARAAAEGADYK